MWQDEGTKGGPLNVNGNRVDGREATRGTNKNRLCLWEIIGLVFSATGSARSLRTYSDKFLKKQSRKGHVIFYSFYPPEHINSSANSRKEHISANQECTHAQRRSQRRSQRRLQYRAEHIFSLPSLWVSISLCHSVLSRVWHNAWQQFGAADLQTTCSNTQTQVGH